MSAASTCTNLLMSKIQRRSSSRFPKIILRTCDQVHYSSQSIISIACGRVLCMATDDYYRPSYTSSSTTTSTHSVRYKSSSTTKYNDVGTDWSADQKPSAASPNKNLSQHNGLARIRPLRHSSLVDLPGTIPMHYPNHDGTSFELQVQDFAISKPKRRGGHVLLGLNGSGKSLLVNYLSHPETYFSNDDSGDVNLLLLKSSQIAYVSFDSHLTMLQEHPHRTVHNVITGGFGNLSKAAQYLVVRFGLFPLLTRTVSTLSTGEIRKCLLVSALCQDPELLILENAFDGLDMQSRKELLSIVSKTIRGLDKSGKLLIQQVQATNVRPVQVLMSTHRPEEIVDEISTVSMTVPTTDDDDRTKKYKLITVDRPEDYTQEQLLYTALGLNKDHNNKSEHWSTVAPWEEDDPTLPSLEEIHAVWTQDKEKTPDTLISLDHVEIRRHRDGNVTDNDNDDDGEFVTLLHDMSWKIQKGQRWLIAGGNGAGKSTLSRFLLHDEQPLNDIDMDTEDEDDCIHDLVSGDYYKNPAAKIGWTSTESHLGMVAEQALNGTTDKKTMWEVITHDGTISRSTAETIAQWVFGDRTTVQEMKDRPLQELSQGQQKLALMAAALVLRPNVLILDEPTTGLDWISRRRVLALLERVCQATPDDLSLIFITHYQEELVPSISHVLHLDHGYAVYQGPKSEYNPLVIPMRDKKKKAK
jgi:molybdate transport system ATP-binding protein